MKIQFRSLFFVLPFFCAAGVSAEADFDLEQVKALGLNGDLDAAKSLLAEQIDTANVSPDQRIQQHLEMARVLDRIGLHQDTRPVAEALAHIELAAELLDCASESSRAPVNLAFATYYYRAGMREREFAKAEEYGQRAIMLYAASGDAHGQADAVHLLGLINLFRQEPDLAEALFEESLRLDISAGERTLFRGEYERHVGYVAYQRGDIEGAVRYFERSLVARLEAGAVDKSMFAAISLALALIELGRPEEAKPHLDYALGIAQRIGSPVAMERIKEAEKRSRHP